MGIQDNIDGEELARRILEESKAEPLETTQCKAFPPWFDEKKFKSLHKSMMEVRGKHCAASKSAESSQFGPISQQDMALTQFGFMGFALIQAEYLGIQGTEEDVEGFLHVWRTVGHFMGIKDKYNLCHLSDNLTESKKCCDIIRDKMFKPLMENPHEDFPSMCMALLLGIKAFVPSNDPEGFLLFTKFLCGIDVNIAKLAVYGRMMYRFQDFIHTHILNSPFWRVVFKPILNFNMWFAVFVCERFTSTISALHFGRR